MSVPTWSFGAALFLNTDPLTTLPLAASLAEGTPPPAVEWTANDKFPLNLYFFETGGGPGVPPANVQLPAGTAIVLTAKTGAASAAALISITGFSQQTDGAGDIYYTAIADLTGSPLAAAVTAATQNPLQLYVDVELQNAANTQRLTLHFPLLVRAPIQGGSAPPTLPSNPGDASNYRFDFASFLEFTVPGGGGVYAAIFAGAPDGVPVIQFSDELDNSTFAGLAAALLVGQNFYWRQGDLYLLPQNAAPGAGGYKMGIATTDGARAMALLPAMDTGPVVTQGNAVPQPGIGTARIGPNAGADFGMLEFYDAVTNLWYIASYDTTADTLVLSDAGYAT